MKAIELRGNEKLDKLITKTLSSRKEELIVGFGKTAKTREGLIFLIKDIDFANEHFLSRSYAGLKWDAALTAQWVGKAEENKEGIVLIHSHSGRGRVNFSSTDFATKERMLEHFNKYLVGVASGYIVIGEDDLMGDFIYSGERFFLDSIRSVSLPIVIRRKFNRTSFIPSLNHHRQEIALGRKANKILRSSTVAVVGLGGVGSMIAQQLAHLKVGKVILIDKDQLERSNLSRVVGTSREDVGKYKTDLSERLIKTIDSSVEVVKMTDFAPTDEIYNELKQVDIILSCVDKIPVKVALNNFSKRYIVPLIDIGVTIRRKRNTVTNINGQVVRVNPNHRCLKCLGIISKILEEQQAIADYGTKVKNPQVITYNGVLASLGLGEMLKVLTGIAGKDNETANLSYDGLTGEIIRVKNPDFICDVCRTQFAEGDPLYL